MNMNVFVEYFYDYRSFNLYLWGIVFLLIIICIVFFMFWLNLMKILKKKRIIEIILKCGFVFFVKYLLYFEVLNCE